MNPEEKQALVDRMAPAPQGNTVWDAVFLYPQIGFEEYLAWYYKVLVHEAGELHGEWLLHQTRIKDKKWKDTISEKSSVSGH